MREADIEDYLNESDIEDFTPSDEDVGDEEFFVSDHETDSSSSSESEPERPSASNQGCTSSGTSLASLNRGRLIRGPRQRGGRRNFQSSPRSGSPNPTWTVKKFPLRSLHLLEPSYLPQNMEEYDKESFFLQYFDDEIARLIVEKTNQTAVFKTGHSLHLTVEELYVYIGICLVMASVSYPSIRMYWMNKYRLNVIADSMARNRFLLLRNSIKVVFNQNVTAEMKSKDKLWKVRPLITKMQSICRMQKKEQYVSIDEMIIPFTGACGVRIYCPGKPNPVGIKAFVLANPNGMICDFHIYEGSTTYPCYDGTSFGLGEKAVLTLTEGMVPRHVVYCDRYFTSEKLVIELDKRGIGCTGTLMKNRIPMNVRTLLKSDKDLKRSGRGSSQTVVKNDDKIAITKWFDNKPVIMMSSVEAKEEEDQCQRWCKLEKKYAAVNRPRVIKQYNANMGDVDLADRLLAVCPHRYRSKKWTSRFIAHMMDLVVSNS